MTEQVLKILLVEDNPGDARLVDAMLSTTTDGAFSVVHAKRLDEALGILTERAFDAVLLDLSLPDSNGINTVDQTAAKDPDSRTPIIVLTGRLNEQDELQTMQHGVQDYLSKNGLHAENLIRSIRYAVERQRARLKREKAETERREVQEIETLEKMGSPTAMVTARAYGLERLSESSPDTFQTLLEQYAELIEQSIEERKLRVDKKTSQALRVMAQRLGFLRASPRDVVELHVAAMKMTRPLKMTTSYVVVEEARLMLIELMGSLAAYYRSHMVPVGRPKPSLGLETQTDESQT